MGWNRQGAEQSVLWARDAYIERLCVAQPSIDAARRIARRFADIVRAHDVEGFERWLAQTTRCDIAEMRRFAIGLASDLDAVRAAIATGHSSGQVEGQINRLKLLKRQMYGRAKLDLLQARLLAPS